MQIRCLLLHLLFVVSAISCLEWRELKIVTVNKDGQFDKRIQKSLESALKWMEKAIYTWDAPHKYLVSWPSKMVDGYKTEDSVGRVTIQTPNKLFSVDYNSQDFREIFDAADLVVFITQSDCKKAIAEASGGPLVMQAPNLRQQMQKLGSLRYCYHEYNEQFNYFDLFRHELIHVLGYGTMSKKDVDEVKSEAYEWKFEDGSDQEARRYFFNTEDENAKREVMKHFDCDSLDGVEADNEGKHLDEYIFFNELMTPLLNQRNYFSYISAAIIDGITLGDEPWYRVNRTFIAPEADLYSYGKGFGCTFLKKSCFEFLAERKESTNPRPAPFCLEDSVKKCFVVNGKLKTFSCLQDPYTGQPAENGILPPKDKSKYNNPILRYCPIFMNYYQLEQFEMVDCSHE
ncbi:unnamed protein product [Caenorhabditis brenneri]